METTGKPNLCPRCDAPLAGTALGGFCPDCIAALALGPEPETPTAPASARAPNFADYELLGEIARGGMGIVFKARHRKLQRTVALKMVRSGKLAGPTELQRFRAETQAAARLQHPNIVTIFEVGEADGLPFFSME